MKKIMKGAFALLLAVLANLVGAQPVIDIGPESPVIIVPPRQSALVLEDREGRLEFPEVLASVLSFRPATEMPPPNSLSAYWVVQTVRNVRAQEQVIRIVPSAGMGWHDIHIRVVDASGQVTDLSNYSGLHGMHNRIAWQNPLRDPAGSAPSQYALYTLRPGQTATLFLRMFADQRFPPKSYAPQIIDHQRYLEMRRLGLYIEGALAGAILALAIFGWYTVAHNPTQTSITYGVWILFALLSALAQPVHDGQRLFELFIDITNVRAGHLYLTEIFSSFFNLAQSMAYVVFARTFLELKDRFPGFYKVTQAYLIFYALVICVRFLWDQHVIPAPLFWLPIAGSTWLVLLGIFVCAYQRMREGFDVARFFMVAMLPYLLFRTIFLFNVLSWPTPLSLLPDSGFFFFIKESTTSQAFGITLEALIMALAVVARSRGLQEQLAHNIQAQKTLVENQNRVLEATVAERTRELADQHEQLEQAHMVVVGSVNYASRLQRSQLPRTQRLDNRFQSLGVIWEPRDTIGGDLWWVSSSQHAGPFTLTVADCTGHGVPGAMLSLLVSTSLERIHSTDPEVRPAALLNSLDQLVRSGLNQDAHDSESDDGCDAAVLRIDRAASRIEFAGAKIGLFHLSADGIVHRYQGSRASLGYRDPPNEKDWPADLTIRYAPGDAFVIVTDGFTDQLGGDKAVPVAFGYRRIEQLLQTTVGLDARQIASKLHEAFCQWQGTKQRRDDVTVVAFRL